MLRRMICSVPEVKANCDGAEAPKIAVRVKFTSKKPATGRAELMGEAPPVNEFGNHRSILDPKRICSGGLFTGVVPVQAVFPPPLNGSVVGPVIA